MTEGGIEVYLYLNISEKMSIDNRLNRVLGSIDVM